MKQTPLSRTLALTLLATFALAATPASHADVVIDTFDTDTTVTPWTATWGTSPTLDFSTENSAGPSGSGSLRVTADYFVPGGTEWEQMVITRTFETQIIGSEFESVSVDIKVDPASIPTAAGQYGYFELKRTGGSAIGGVNLTSTNWTTITFPLAATEGPLTGIIIQNGNSGFAGPIIYHLDNFRFNAPPPPQTVIDTFPDQPSIASWSPTWGTAPILTWATLDKAGSATSGSLKVEADYFVPGGTEWEQMVITRAFENPVVGSQHSSVSIDVKVDPASVPNTAGQYGYFELKRTDGSAIGGVNLTSTNWITITFPLAATEGSLTGIIIQNGSSGFQGPITYTLDNLVFTQIAGGPAPPSLAIERSTIPGLKVYASAPGQAYQRQNIFYTPSGDLANNLWWVNQPDPVTYSITWADFPNPANYLGFQGQIVLSADSGGSVTPDWNDANVIYIEFQYVNTAGADGTNGTPDDQVMAQARFLHKVNGASSNAMLYNADPANGPVGILGQLRAPSMLGTWSVSFRNNTDIILTAPDNSTVNLVMPADSFPLFEPATTGVSASFGVQPNADTRVGQSATISRIRITKGSTTVVDESFTSAELDPANWTVRAQDPGGIFPATPDLAYLVSWPLPDPGFVLKAGANLTGPWTDFGTPSLVGARRVVRVNRTALPGPNAGFFQLRGP